MKTHKYFWLTIFLLCLFILQATINAAYAQEPLDEPGEQPPALEPSGVITVTLQQLGEQEVMLWQRRPVKDYDLSLPGNVQYAPGGNYLELITTHSPEIPDKPSSLKVTVNDQPAATVELTGTNAISNVTRIELPEGVLKIGENEVEVALDIDGLTCEEPNAFIEVLIDPATRLSLNYEQVPYPVDLSLYPFPFSEDSLTDIPVTIVLPNRPTSEDLSTAATLVAGLGEMGRPDLNLRVVPATGLNATDRAESHLIVIGTPDNNRLLGQLPLPLPADDTILKPGQGMLAEMVSPWNDYRVVLAVTGLDMAGVSKATQALNRRAHFLGMRGPVAVVLDVLPLTPSDAPRPAGMTLASMGHQDQVMRGTLARSFRVNFDLPLGWRLEEEPLFVLKFNHADSLDPYESVIDVDLNGVPVASALLNASNVNNGELLVTMPAHLLRTGGNYLDIRAEMNLHSDNLCNGLDPEQAWTVIRADSELFLPYNALTVRPGLDLFPYPFSQPGSFNQTLFVLPNEPSSLTLTDLMALVARMGAAANQPENISVKAAYASEVDEAQLREHHLVLLGRPSENTLLAEINGQLPHPFMPDSDLLQPLVVDNIAFSPDPTRDAGLLQLIDSPWNNALSVLAVTGTTNEGVRLAYQALIDQAGALKGNLAVVEPAVGPLAVEPNLISSYSIDTRPQTAEASRDRFTGSEEDTMMMSRRLWR